MARKNLFLCVALVVLLISTKVYSAQGEGKGNGNGYGNGKGNGNGKGKGDERGNGEGNGSGNDHGKEKEKGDGKDKGKGGGNGKGHEKGKGNGKGDGERVETDYVMVSPVEKTGQERAVCQSEGSRCYEKTLRCPAQCSKRKPKKAEKNKARFIDCNKCETTCKSKSLICITLDMLRWHEL